MSTRARYCVAVKAKDSTDTWEDWRHTPVGREVYRSSRRTPEVETSNGITYLIVDTRNRWTPLLPADVLDNVRHDWRYSSQELFQLTGLWEVLDVWYTTEDTHALSAIIRPGNHVTRARIAARDRVE